MVVPRSRFKADAEHHVPLSDAAVAIIAGLPRFSASANDFIFTTRAGAIAVNGMSNAKARLDQLMLRRLRALARMRGEDPAAVQLAPFKTHDTRRVVRSQLSALDVPDHIAEAALGHGRKGIARTYDTFKYLPQIREALERWSAKLRTIVAPTSPTPVVPDNVVALSPKKARAS